MPIPVPAGDAVVRSRRHRRRRRSTSPVRSTIQPPATEAGDPRQQINEITAFIDASNVYGSDAVRAAELRTLRRRTPQDQRRRPAAVQRRRAPQRRRHRATRCSWPATCGPTRTSALTSMHTLFVREHNRIADEMAAPRSRAHRRAALPAGPGDGRRRDPGHHLQRVPAGAAGLRTRSRPTRATIRRSNPGIANKFSTAAYRFGHSMLSTDCYRLNNDGTTIADGNLSLRDAFFAPQQVTDHGIDSLLLGAASQQAQEIDASVVDDVRNFLFGPPGSGGFDLAALNIQRGRDHGLPDYNQARAGPGARAGQQLRRDHFRSHAGRETADGVRHDRRNGQRRRHRPVGGRTRRRPPAGLERGRTRADRARRPVHADPRRRPLLVPERVPRPAASGNRAHHAGRRDPTATPTSTTCRTTCSSCRR